MTESIKVSVAIDYGNGNIINHSFNVPLEQKKEVKVQVNGGGGKLPENAQQQIQTAVAKAVSKKEFLPEFKHFIDTGDISQIKAMPDHRNIFKPCVFAQIYDIKGRTVYANKPTRINNKYVGVLPAAHFSDELIEEIKAKTDKEEVINVVFLDDGSKPALIYDIALVENWNVLGHAFNSLYRQPKNV